MNSSKYLNGLKQTNSLGKEKTTVLK